MRTHVLARLVVFVRQSRLTPPDRAKRALVVEPVSALYQHTQSQRRRAFTFHHDCHGIYLSPTAYPCIHRCSFFRIHVDRNSNSRSPCRTKAPTWEVGCWHIGMRPPDGTRRKSSQPYRRHIAYLTNLSLRFSYAPGIFFSGCGRIVVAFNSDDQLRSHEQLLPLSIVVLLMTSCR